MAILKARKVKKVYGRKLTAQEVLKGIDIEVNEGEFVGIMGPSGSGKTTLLNVLCSIDNATEGVIEIDGNDLRKMKEKELSKFRREQLGFIFQDYNLLDTLTVKENILLPLSISKVSKSEAESRFNTLTDLLDIRELANKYPNEISGGQKQRTSAARALISNPSIVFGDEPTGALDSKSATALLENLATINEKQRVTIMMVTHDPVAASFCSRVLFLKDGQLYTELYKGEKNRKMFFQEIMNTQGVLGGDGYDD
ncbi:ABC transporter ATP-binding protein [Viridibacillus sp. FSL R5-0477]|uniref:Bacitracin export ATP-binding protein n=1 Tax=Viridibacillus arenosi FSL R5-213 TaxID=1227360 RepID=W4F8L0_9BACL|nr:MULTISPECIES: ABC transporter ATP-binding protein [Viridibacillus]ETT88672.1 bacitracin export ATP-binding protein [Viridibacillus arenosi FSL R5-213]OMC81218.1 bacitracin ABC transporter ATP-binding protein [Viridibacillus sp. FSL H8-0123]OMC85029.1 bacitracin ABC transporter ATP-binding protein [Viridibacillus sp. FSL H7-0596]OMC90280.1 bacitracin ABC transporter ATP-binding protein [Viridibacillus arenosi]